MNEESDDQRVENVADQAGGKESASISVLKLLSELITHLNNLRRSISIFSISSLVGCRVLALMKGMVDRDPSWAIL